MDEEAEWLAEMYGLFIVPEPDDEPDDFAYYPEEYGLEECQ